MIQKICFKSGVLQDLCFQELYSLMLMRTFPGRNGEVWEKMQRKGFFYTAREYVWNAHWSSEFCPSNQVACLSHVVSHWEDSLSRKFNMT